MVLPNSSFANVKALKFIFTLGEGSTASLGGNYNSVTLEGLRANIHIDNAGSLQMGTLKAQIFGMTESDMNALTSFTWGTGAVGLPNTIQVYAVDGAQSVLIFNGSYIRGWIVYNSMPDVYFMVDGQVGFAQQMTPATPTSIESDTSVATIAGQLAARMGMQFENNGVNISVPKGTYLANSLLEQMKKLQSMYGFSMYVDSAPSSNASGSGNILAITPYGVGRDTPAALVSSETGLDGYPIFSDTGVNFETYFNPNIVYGGQITIPQGVQPPGACGDWVVQSMSHDLASVTPGGAWKTTVSATSKNLGGALTP